MFSSLSTAQVASGQAVSNPTMDTIRTDLDDLNSRLTTVEGAVGSLPPIDFAVFGTLNPPMAITGLIYYRVTAAITLTAARAIAWKAGSAGTLDVDVQYKRGGGAWTSILSSSIQVGFGAGDLGMTTGTLVVTSLLPGDFLRLNVNGVQTGMQDFSVELENQVA
jgi:hypothetical protein